MLFMGRAYVLFVAIVLTTMATRIGWIDWRVIGASAATLAINALVVLIATALLLGLPAVLLATFIGWLLRAPSAAPTHAMERPR